MTQYEPESSPIWTWRTGAGLRGFAWVFAALTPCCIAATVWATVAGVPGFDDKFAVIVLPPMWLGAAACIWVVANRPFVTADANGVLIQNVMSRERLRWDEITKITPGYSGLKFERADGRAPVYASALSKSNYSQAAGHDTRADLAARQLAQRASDGGSASAELLPTTQQQTESRRTATWVIAVGFVLIAARIAIEFV